ncbi:MAG: hypothetical protein MUC35_03875 [Candidatus Margulisbacteria bacterium]|jgi:hypothetical protein|nr:hypothetical protein [Candidatus Margulisiibacteriota bacterium]
MTLAVAASAAIDPVTISSGATFTTTFSDIKGQSLIGGSGTLQLGSIYTLLGAPAQVGTAPPGTVPLTITRSGNDIVLTWDKNSAPSVDIYTLTGDGSGVYSDSGFTVKMGTHTSGTLTDTAQVGAGNPEKYYKGVMTGYDSFLLGPEYGNKTCLQAAQAVGKVNYVFAGGNNFFNYPFAKTDTINTIFGNKAIGQPGTAVNIASGSRVLAHNYSAGNFEVSELSGTAGTSQWSALTLAPSKGNIFFNASTNNINVTLVGQVVPDLSVASSALGGNNLTGLVYPKGEKITLFSNSKSGDRLLVQNATGSFDTIDCTGANSWANGAYALKPTLGYWYYRDPKNGNMTWQQSRP